MAARTLVETYIALRDATDWLNSIQLASICNRGARTCHMAANELVKAGAIRSRMVDKRVYFKICIDLQRVENLPIIVDINETITIKEND